MESQEKPFSIRTIQLSFFSAAIDLSDRLKVANIVTKALEPNLNGTPTILPFPDDAPLEIPRISLNNKTKDLICNIAANRIDLLSKGSNENQDLADNWKDLFSDSGKLANAIFADLSIKVNRIGLVINYNFAPNIEGLKFLKDKYLHNQGEDSIELQIHKLKLEKITDFEANHWLRLIAIESKEGKSSLLAVSDINTKQNSEHNFTKESAIIYIQSAFEVSKETVLKVLK